MDVDSAVGRDRGVVSASFVGGIETDGNEETVARTVSGQGI